MCLLDKRRILGIASPQGFHTLVFGFAIPNQLRQAGAASPDIYE